MCHSFLVLRLGYRPFFIIYSFHFFHPIPVSQQGCLNRVALSLQLLACLVHAPQYTHIHPSSSDAPKPSLYTQTLCRRHINYISYLCPVDSPVYIDVDALTHFLLCRMKQLAYLLSVMSQHFHSTESQPQGFRSIPPLFITVLFFYRLHQHHSHHRTNHKQSSTR